MRSCFVINPISLIAIEFFIVFISSSIPLGGCGFQEICYFHLITEIIGRKLFLISTYAPLNILFSIPDIANFSLFFFLISLALSLSTVLTENKTTHFVDFSLLSIFYLVDFCILFPLFSFLWA